MTKVIFAEQPTTKQFADLIIEPEWIIPIVPFGLVLQKHAIVLRDGCIIALIPRDEAEARFMAPIVMRLPGEVLMPGLINLHCHSAMTLLRGFADDLPLKSWLQEKIWPTEARLVDQEFVRTGSLLACLEMLRGGITCFNDMYFFPEKTAEAALETGIRASIGMIVIDFPTPYAPTVDAYLSKGLELRQRFLNESRLSFCMAPHAPYTVGDQTFSRVVELAQQLELGIHLHAHETKDEIQEEFERTGKRPLERLQQLGVLGQKTIIAHAVHLAAAEIALVAQTRTHLAHCPTSNLKLGSGIANVPAWLGNSINFGLGTDGAASNNRLDLWQEIRHAALLAKGCSGDASMLDCHSVLHSATLGGAKALGLDARVGSLEPGKSADMITVKLDNWISQPSYDPASHLVYVTGREQVSNVWVQGRQLVTGGEVEYMDLPRLIDQIHIWQSRARSS